MDTAIHIFPPEAERYLIAKRFANRVSMGVAAKMEVEYMNRYLAIPTDFDTWFPSFEGYQASLNALFASEDEELSDERKAVA